MSERRSEGRARGGLRAGGGAAGAAATPAASWAPGSSSRAATDADLRRRTSYLELAPSGPAPVRWGRRVLYRLLRPVLWAQSEEAFARAAEAARLHERMLILERELSARDAAPAGRPAAARPPIDMKAFEDELRGSEETISERQRPYLRHFSAGKPVLDVGCGRGEFLELLGEAGIEGVGVDADPRMVAHCRAKGLDVVRSEAIAHLRSRPAGSLGGIFCAQVIEHLEPVELVELVEEAARVLCPGGTLLLETVNPESLLNFGTFYMDLTHVRPYHARAVANLVEARGFAEVRVEYSIRPEEKLLIPPLPPALRAEAPALDLALQRLSALVYGPLAYAVTASRRNEEGS